jgi:hypothetical protein
MKLRPALFALAALVALAALAGCDLLGAGGGSFVGGTIYWPNGQVDGGTSFRVILYSAGTAMNPAADASLPESLELAPRALDVEGSFPGSPPTLHSAVTYQVGPVPPGTYSLFVWIDANGDGAFDLYSDPGGFRLGLGGYELSQPAANLVVPEAGFVDADVRVTTYD